MGKEKTYPVEMDQATMRELVQFIDTAHDLWSGALTPSKVWHMKYDLEDILRNGCFKHRVLAKNIGIDKTTTITICPKCNPTKYREIRLQASRFKKGEQP